MTVTANALTIATPTDRDVVLTRRFDAPRDVVYAALTQPDLLRRWYGPDGWVLDVCDIDLRVGGRWRFVVRRPDGKAIGQRGEYRELVAGERIVNTEAWEDWDPGECLVVTELRALDGGTLLVSTTTFPTRAVRDTVLESGLERGAKQSYDRLAALVAATAVSATAPASRR